MSDDGRNMGVATETAGRAVSPPTSPAERRKSMEASWLAAVDSAEKEAKMKATQASPTPPTSPAEGRKAKERAWLAIVDSPGKDIEDKAAVESKKDTSRGGQNKADQITDTIMVGSESHAPADRRQLVSSGHGDNAGHSANTMASEAAQKRLQTRARARAILKIAAHMMRGVHEMQKAVKAKQEHVCRLNEAAAEGGPNAPTKAERIRAVTELVSAKREETRATRLLTPQKNKKANPTRTARA